MRGLLFVLTLVLLTGSLAAADISGVWTAEVALDAGNGTATFELKQTGETVTGSYSGALGAGNVKGTVKGDQVEWWFESNEAGKIQYHGTLEGAGKIKGTVDYGELGKGTFTAQKKP